MNTVIIGLGAIGGVYATALYNNNLPVRIACDAERLKRYANNPFIFNNKQYPFDYFTPKSGDPVADLIIIATKWNGYLDALKTIKPIAGPNTQILPLLNGITSEPLAIEQYGQMHVLHGYFIGHTAAREDRSATQDGEYITVFGERKNNLAALTPRVAKIKELFDSAGIRYRIDPDMESSLWQKYIINIGLNQVTAALRKPYGAVKSDPQALQLTEGLMNEAAAIATKIGIAGADKMVVAGLASLSKMRPQDSSSMLQDIEAGRPTEIDMFAGEICRLGKVHGIPTPLNNDILNQFKKN